MGTLVTKLTEKMQARHQILIIVIIHIKLKSYVRDLMYGNIIIKCL